MFCSLINEYHIDTVVSYFNNKNKLINDYKRYMIIDGFNSYIYEEESKEEKFVELSGCLNKLYILNTQLQKMYKQGISINNESYKFLSEIIELYEVHGNESSKYKKYFRYGEAKDNYTTIQKNHAEQFLENYKELLILLKKDE